MSEKTTSHFRLIEADTVEDLNEQINEAITEGFFCRQTRELIIDKRETEDGCLSIAMRYYAEMATPIIQSMPYSVRSLPAVPVPSTMNQTGLNALAEMGRMVQRSGDREFMAMCEQIGDALRDNPKFREMWLEPVKEMMKDAGLTFDEGLIDEESLNRMFVKGTPFDETGS